MNRLLGVVLPIAAGALAGAAGAAAVGYFSRAPQVVAELPSPKPTVGTTAPDVRQARRGWRAFSAPTQEALPAAPPAEAVSPPPDEPEDPGVSLAREVDHQKDLLASFTKEPEDARWARATEGAVTEALTRVSKSQGEQSFGIEEARCRSSLCVATVKWASYFDAQRTAAAIAGQNPEVPCAVELTIPPPSDPSAEYQASVVYRCDRL